MKNLSKKVNGQNANYFASFSNVQLNKAAQKALKGGSDIIIVEDPIVG